MGGSGDDAIEIVVYGKVIVDDIRLRDGQHARDVLGGGGPQAAFGARLWNDSVGLLTRTGTDLSDVHAENLLGIAVNMDGWDQYPDIPTPRVLLQYDADEHLSGSGLVTSHADWRRLLDQPLDLPPAYRRPRAIHLVTEFPGEPMIASALELRGRGALLSLEPLPSKSAGTNWAAMMVLIGQSDIVCPDWPSATGVAEADDPLKVLQHWSALGPECIAVRHGALGSYVWGRERDEAWHIPAIRTTAFDPTGAGNAYGGGLCAGWTETRDARIAGCYGAISAAFLVRRVGLPLLTAELEREARSLLAEAMAEARPL